MKNEKVAFLGIMGALALVLGFMENLLIPDIPFLPVGAKPGLSNVVTMYVAAAVGFPGAIYITLIKSAFAFITRGATAFFMSFCGGALSTVAVCLLLKYGKKLFSFWGIGVISAVMHNMGQLFAACVISGTAALVSYGRYLLIFALITGSVTGVLLLILMPRTEGLIKYSKLIKSIEKEKKYEQKG